MQWSAAMQDARYAGQARAVLTRSGRAHLANFLDEAPAQLLFQTARETEFLLATNAGGNANPVTAADVARLGEENIMRAAYGEAQRARYSFAYDAFQVSVAACDGALTQGPLYDFFRYINSPPAIAFFRAMTGDDTIVYVDAQLSRYRHGQYLTEHTDLQPDGHRLFAYVLNLTPVWRADWGGLLMFMNSDGHVAEAYTPRWRAFNVFKVPQPHAVSAVAPFANAHRYSITGWMRAIKPRNLPPEIGV